MFIVLFPGRERSTRGKLENFKGERSASPTITAKVMGYRYNLGKRMP